MGLDIYAGTLTRYYSHNWKTVVQQWAEENGYSFNRITPDGEPADDEELSPTDVQAAVENWRDQILAAISQPDQPPYAPWPENNEKPYYTDKPDWDAFGAIVLLETMKAADKDHRVFKLQFEAGEFDMVIYDQKENSCEIFEIKHSSKQVPFQYRHLVDEDKCQRTERRFGPIHGRYILYRGEDAQMENGVQYWNVENYLKALPTLDIVQVQEIGMQSIEPTL